MAPTPLPSRFRRFLWCVLGGLLLYALFGFLVLPPLVRAQAEKRLSAALGRTVTIGQIRCNPFLATASIVDLDVREAGGAASFLSWQELFVDFEALASLGGEWVIGEVALRGFRASVQVRADGSLNFSDLLARMAPTPEPRPSPATPAGAPPGRPWRVDHLEVAGARLDLADQSRSRPFSTQVGPVTFSLSSLHTAPERLASGRFEAATESGERFAWTGTVQATPFRSEGELQIENLHLPKYDPFHRTLHQLDVTDGKLSVRGRYQVNLAPANRAVRLLDAALQLRGLKLVDRTGNSPVLELASAEVSGLRADADGLRTEVGTVALSGGRVHLRREKDGSIHLFNLLQPSPGAAPGSKPAKPESVPSSTPLSEIKLGELAVRGFQLEIADLAAPRPAQLALQDVEATLRNFSLADGATMPVELALNWAPRGRIQTRGELILKPALAARLHTEVRDFEILPLSPYLEQFVNARLTQGAFGTTHDLRFSLAPGKPEVNFAGEVRLEKLGLVDAAHNEDLAGLGSLTFSGLQFTAGDPPVISVDAITVIDPFARILVNPDHSLNLSQLARSQPKSAPAAAPTPPTSPAPPPRVTVARVDLRNGKFSFADRSLPSSVAVSLGGFSGAILGLSSENMARAEVDLRGAVDGVGPVAITGRLDPLGPSPFVDLKLDGRNIDLLPFSPYSGHFAGFALARGKLGVEVRLQVDGPRLDAANVVTLDQFTFGAPVESAEATKLPVRLAVALLKDLDGRIVIDLPVQGRLDDPEFKVGRVIGRVLINLLTKAAVSPFKLLGSMFGGGGDELAYQEFAPGQSDLLPAGRPKLETMAKALAQRPGLSVVVEGSCDPAADAHALRRVKLAEKIRRAAWEEKHARDPNIPPPAQLVLSPAEEAATITALYDREFPPGTQFGAPVPPPPPVIRPPDPPAGLVKRLVRAISGQAKREQKAAQAENDRRVAEHRAAVEKALAQGRPLDEMLGRLAERVAVEPADLSALAASRAQRVRDYFVREGAIAGERVFLAQGTETSTPAKGPRVLLSLQ